MKYYFIGFLALVSITLNGMESLDDAVTQGNTKAVQKLVKCYALDHRDNNGKTILHKATVAENPEIADMLVKRCPNLLHIGDKQGKIPLHYAAHYDCLPMAQYLVNAKSKIDCEDANLWTPLFYAVAGLHLAIVNFLISQGAQADRRSGQGETLVHISIPPKKCDERETGIQTRHYAMLQYLIVQKQIPDFITDYKWKLPVEKAHANLPEDDMARRYLEYLNDERQSLK